MLKHDCIEQVIVLADRRLVTFNILQAINTLKSSNHHIISFDHQNLWVNSDQCLSVLDRSYTYRSHVLQTEELTNQVTRIEIDYRAPMLFNCVINASFLRDMYTRFNTFIGGSDPDMDFLAKYIIFYLAPVLYYDAPCIATNARFVTSSTSSNALSNTRLVHTSYAGLSGPRVWPMFADELLTCLIPGAFTQYLLDESIYNFFDLESLFSKCLYECRFPRSYDSYKLIIQQLKTMHSSFDIKKYPISLLDSMEHSPSKNQTYPIDWSGGITNSANLSLLHKFERVL